MRPINRLNQHVIEESMQIVSSLKCGWQQGRIHSLFINMLPFRRIIFTLSTHVDPKWKKQNRPVLSWNTSLESWPAANRNNTNSTQRKKERSWCWRRGRRWIKRPMRGACERKHLHWSCSLCKCINVRQNQPWWETTTAHTMFTTCVILIHSK